MICFEIQLVLEQESLGFSTIQLSGGSKGGWVEWMTQLFYIPPSFVKDVSIPQKVVLPAIIMCAPQYRTVADLFGEASSISLKREGSMRLDLVSGKLETKSTWTCRRTFSLNIESSSVLVLEMSNLSSLVAKNPLTNFPSWQSESAANIDPLSEEWVKCSQLPTW